MENSTLHTIPSVYFPFWNNVNKPQPRPHSQPQPQPQPQPQLRRRRTGLETQHVSSPRYVSSFYFFIFSTNFFYIQFHDETPANGHNRTTTRDASRASGKFLIQHFYYSTNNYLQLRATTHHHKTTTTTTKQQTTTT
jgi:hypothetical protein